MRLSLHPHRLPRIPGPPVVRRAAGVIVLLALVALGGVVASSSWRSAAADAPLPGTPVPADQVQAIAQAALSCPALTATRLAGQLMANSGFDPDARTDAGGSGVAGLSDALWQRWAPWPNAQRQDPAASVTALAHHMCDLVGQIRHADIGGDRWELALAAHHAGFAAVQAAGSVPDDAVRYVTTVNRYTAWYAQQAAFATGSPSPSQPTQVAPTTGSAPRDVPDKYVDLVVIAGRVCPAVGPAQIAAQLMAASGFNPNLLGSDGRQGIAQFLPAVWNRYATAGQSPWDPAAAIPTLGRAMCSLTTELAGLTADPYPVALAAYQWGPTSIAQPGGAAGTPSVKEYADRVVAYAAYYAQDPRLSGHRGTTRSPSARPAPPVLAAPPPHRGSTGGAPRSNPATRGGTTTRAATRAPTRAPTSRSTTAAAQPTYEIYGYAGKCVQAPSVADGQQLVISTCTGSSRQKWQFVSGTIRLGGFCMDLAWASSDNGTRVQLATCNGGWAQKFTVNGSHDLVNTVIGKCVDVKDWNDANGAVLQLWQCNGQANQKWFTRR